MAHFKFYKPEELEAMDEKPQPKPRGKPRKQYDPVYDLSQPLEGSVMARPRSLPRNSRTSKRVGVSYAKKQRVWFAELNHKGKTWRKSCLTEAEAIAWRERFELAAFGPYGNATPARALKHGDKYVHVRAVCQDGVVRMAKQTGDAYDEFSVPGSVVLADKHSVSGRLYVDRKAKVWRFDASHWVPNYTYMLDSIAYENYDNERFSTQEDEYDGDQ